MSTFYLEQLYLTTYISSSPCHLVFHPSLTFHNTAMTEMVVVSLNSFALLCIPKSSCFFHSTFVWVMNVATNHVTFTLLSLTNDHSGNTVGQDQDFWTVDMSKQRFEEQCFWYNNTVFMWVILLVWKKCTIIVGKWRIQEHWIEVSLYCQCCLTECSHFSLGMWLVMWKYQTCG